MVKLNKAENLPPIRLVEENMPVEEIRKRFSTAFGHRYTVHEVRERGEYKFVYFGVQSGFGRPMSEWDKFYEDLDEYGKLWVDYTKILPDDYNTRAEFLEYNRKHPIEYSVEPKEGCWEIQYALKSTGPRISTTSATPRYVPPPPRRSARFVQDRNNEPDTIDTVFSGLGGLKLQNCVKERIKITTRGNITYGCYHSAESCTCGKEPRIIPRTVSVDLPPVATHVPDAKSVCIATVVAIPKAPKKKWYSCVFPKLFRTSLDLDA